MLNSCFSPRFCCTHFIDVSLSADLFSLDCVTSILSPRNSAFEKGLEMLILKGPMLCKSYSTNVF